jgi:WD40 repeat protein
MNILHIAVNLLHEYSNFMLMGQILQVHTDEVWFLQFSHDGKYLASSSKDQSAIIWQVSVSLYVF